MADTGLLPSDLGSQIQGLLSQFQPSQQVLDAANKRAQLDFFLGLLGAPKGLEFRTLGQSGMNALNERDNYIKTQQGLALQNAQLAMPLLQMSMAQRMSQNMQDILNGGGQPSEFPAGAVGGNGMGGGTASTFGPSAQPGPVSGPGNAPGPDMYTRLTNFNLAQMPITGKDYSAAIKARFPEPVSMRPGGYGALPNNQRFFNPIIPPGYMPIDPNNPLKGLQPIPGYQGAQLANAAIPKAASTAFESPTPVVDAAGNETLPQGSRLTQLFGNGPLPYGIPSPFSGQSANTAAPSPANTAPAQPQTGAAPAAPSRVTKLGPEQQATATNAAEFEQSVHEASANSSVQDAQLAEMQKHMKDFTPGPTLPMRANIANYAQEIPGVGSSLANLLVPNAKKALPSIQAFTKLSVNMVAAQAKVFGSREAVQIVDMVRSALPNVGMVEGAPETIMNFMHGMNAYTKATEQALASWKQAHNNSVIGFQEYWHATNPPTNFIPPDVWAGMQKLSGGAALPASVMQSMPQAAPQPQPATGGWSIRRIN